ncbi:hypothetical protein [Paraburkholderia tropica]|uniref:hypothetical protein n=1 Tax=Paraburkholderia tropica TaxID=92647 RepID=UPI00160B7913|nr:hypothetical protein [Paraburkholderia tropica]MBB6320564.1 hypothetical protein [Paraburkholderia tropica]
MNCKPGDLAIVTYTRNGELVGCVVEVLRGWGEFGELGYLWTIRMPRALQLYVPTGADAKCGIPSRVSTDSQFPDAWLRPVSGLPVHDEQLDEVTA